MNIPSIDPVAAAITVRLPEGAVEAVEQVDRKGAGVALVVHHDGRTQFVPLSPGRPIIVGRLEPSHVRIPDASLSRRHARLTLQGGVVRVEDLDSTNGVRIRGECVTRGEVGPGDQLLLGRVVVSVYALAPDDAVARRERGRASPHSRAADGGEDDGPIIASPAMRRLFEAIDKLRRSSISVLLRGETGTGKEILARALHDRSDRRSGPMVSVNCGALPRELVESTLFGHERGSFTGAVQQQKGVFEAAHGGTVFLDELGELPASAQAALLRVLETKRVTRVGSSRETTVDIRLIAATHRDLEVMCDEGTFRLDLLYRLNTMVLTLPPLRERPEEIEPLALRFTRQAAREHEREIRGIDPAVLSALHRYSFPGNVRELRNAIERAVIVAEGNTITLGDLPERVRDGARPASPSPARRAAAPLDDQADLRERVQRYESELIQEALRQAGGNQTEAARRLRMPLRTLVHKLKALGIRRRDAAPGERDAPSKPHP
ncbi:sigma 54-interacting transcriptional regulator [Polyangium jinanense]|uniref:Sigma 54-interacting transcriptional regulator n=1 Tax=Polyangium jinanense TaxID=2829994 RepID=A0A9X4AXS2_9BACT|nr:sigma 54-interacting transcriptional regulator [Polyangium jinanense]MDC3959758.1 sigma 54-interacting transcriptional regulator [Polyangium jinanense]MDC3988913.1 sigma 54-interacting transcriptional regulator [Polyangium jinanense]